MTANREWFQNIRLRWAVSAVALAALVVCAIWMTHAPDQPAPAEKSREPVSNVPAELREKIDRWILERKLNRYGDPPGTAYTGGTPLFDPKSGTYKDRYLYILDRHPELRKGE